MKVIDKYTLLPHACSRIKAVAASGLWDGRSQSEYFENCRWLLERFPCTIVFTKETGYHSSGWWKNPDYERCWHLSIAFPGGKDKKGLSDILVYLFGQFKNLLWVEPPYSDIGKSKEVWHYRLFCDENWQPIKPRGEVYNTHFTERGWKSFSELNASNQK
jgi:hypothetical protein